MRPARAKSEGDSLIEVMIALSITAIAALGLVATQTWLARSERAVLTRERATLIADSVAEGAQLMTDKQIADLAAAAGAAQQAELAAAARAAEGTADISASEDGTGEDISMEDVLGAGTRKQPAAARDSVAEDIPQVETQKV